MYVIVHALYIKLTNFFSVFPFLYATLLFSLFYRICLIASCTSHMLSAVSLLGKAGNVHKSLVGNRRRQQHQSVHYRLTPQWGVRSIREQNNNLQPPVRGEDSRPGVFYCDCVCVYTCACSLYGNALT